MSDRPEPGLAHPTAEVRAHTHMSRRWRHSLIWAIPIVTAAIGGWLAWDTLSQRGPLITLTFQDAQGLQVDQSHVRHKDVDMGVVRKIALTSDLQNVVITVRMNREAEPLLTDKTQFWVVKPRFFAGSISGVETLLSGAYIELLPSTAGGAPKRDFVGLEDPPVLQTDAPGRIFLLQAPRIGSISLGSPVFYRDFTVGEVLGWDIGDMADSVTIHAFVRAPFDQYVHDGSRFWNASGLSLKLGPNGLQVELQSLRAVMLGGIAFDTPPETRATPVSSGNRGFRLYANQEAADTAAYTRRIPCVAYLGASVAGLSPDSVVTLHGLPVGHVNQVQLQYDAADDRIVVPVHFEVEPERIARMPAELVDGNMQTAMAALVQRGLRVRLESASLITGQKQLTLDYVPDAPAVALRMQGDNFVIPTLGNGGDDPISSAGALMAKLSAIPFEQIGDNLNKTLQGTSEIANSEQLKRSLATLQATLAGVQDLVKRVNSGVGSGIAAAALARGRAGGYSEAHQPPGRLGGCRLRRRLAVQPRGRSAAGAAHRCGAFGARAVRSAGAASGSADTRPHRPGAVGSIKGSTTLYRPSGRRIREDGLQHAPRYRIQPGDKLRIAHLPAR